MFAWYKQQLQALQRAAHEDGHRLIEAHGTLALQAVYDQMGENRDNKNSVEHILSCLQDQAICSGQLKVAGHISQALQALKEEQCTCRGIYDCQDVIDFHTARLAQNNRPK